ncbi:MAG: bifunctional oligoribonuclease/PAP phosphatase NrnA [Bacteroidota bacterium]
MKNRFPYQEVLPLIKLLLDPKRIVITTHHKPDGDAMGSSLGLYNYLLAKGHHVTVVVPSDYPDFLEWMPGNHTVIEYPKAKEQCKQLFNDAEILFCLDFNQPNRVEEMEADMLASKAIKVLIDHHLHPQAFCDHTFSYPLACATAELVYQFIVSMDDKTLINKAVADCLYTGIMTDTNSFRFETMTADTHRTIAGLMDAGAANYVIHENVYDNFSYDRMKMVGFSLFHRLVMVPEFKTAYISLSQEDLKQFKSTTGDTEGVVNLALSIKDVKLAAFFYETPHLVKISLRSKGVFSVKEVAQAHFQGGGHRNAAGGKSFTSIDDAIKKFLSILPDYKHELLK